MLYRTRRSHAFACLFGGVPLIAIGLGGMILCLRENPDFVDDGGILAFFGLIGAVGLFGVVAASNVACRRITMDADGFVRHSLFGARCVQFAWSDVDCWLTWPVKDARPLRESAYLYMKADGSLKRRRPGEPSSSASAAAGPPLFVPEQEVSQPSFEPAFSRRFAGKSELANFAPAASTAPEPAVVDAIQVPIATCDRNRFRRDR